MKNLLKLLLLWVLRLFKPRSTESAPANPRHLTVFRFGGIGDLIVLTGLLQSIQHHFPKAQIRLVTCPAYASIFDGLFDGLEIIGTAPLSLTSPWLQLLRDVRRVNREKTDIAIFLHSDFESLFCSYFVKASFKIGFDPKRQGFDFALDRSIPLMGYKAKPGDHVNKLYHELFRTSCTDGMSELHEPLICLRQSEKEWAASELAKRGFKRTVVLAITGSEGVKLWPIDRFVCIAREIVSKPGLSVLILGGPVEARHADAFANISSQIWFAAGTTSLRETFALIGLSLVVVGGDTGLMHAAYALGVPTLAMFGPTSPHVFGYESPRHVLIQSNLDCVPCGQSSCRLLELFGRPNTVAPCLDQIQYNDVLARLYSVLDQRNE